MTYQPKPYTTTDEEPVPPFVFDVVSQCNHVANDAQDTTCSKDWRQHEGFKHAVNERTPIFAKQQQLHRPLLGHHNDLVSRAFETYHVSVGVVGAPVGGGGGGGGGGGIVSLWISDGRGGGGGGHAAVGNLPTGGGAGTGIINNSSRRRGGGTWRALPFWKLLLAAPSIFICISTVAPHMMVLLLVGAWAVL